MDLHLARSAGPLTLANRLRLDRPPIAPRWPLRRLQGARSHRGRPSTSRGPSPTYVSHALALRGSSAMRPPPGSAQRASRSPPPRTGPRPTRTLAGPWLRALPAVRRRRAATRKDRSRQPGPCGAPWGGPGERSHTERIDSRPYRLPSRRACNLQTYPALAHARTAHPRGAPCARPRAGAVAFLDVDAGCVQAQDRRGARSPEPLPRGSPCPPRSVRET